MGLEPDRHHRWTVKNIPDQHGRTVILTGANSGIGLEAARALAGAGAHVVLACRNRRKATAAAESIDAGAPVGAVETLDLDLARLDSVRDFATAFREKHDRLDVLANNAGVMAIPRRLTDDGFEMQFGTNHLGHFALTGLLLPCLLATDGARVVSVSSGAHRFGGMNFDDLQGEKHYSRFAAYAQSKLANLLFTRELKRRCQAAGASLVVAACHPGWSATNLQFVAPSMDGSRLTAWLASGLNAIFSQDASMGALPTLYAATAPDVSSGDYIGPDGFQELWGHPRKVDPAARARDDAAARRLWEISVELTSVSYSELESD